MKVVCSSSGLINLSHPGQGIMDLLGAGFHDLMIDLSCCYDQELESRIKIDQALWEKCAASQLNIETAYAPYLPRDTKDADLNERLQELTLESIGLCGQAGCHYLIVRPLFAGVGKEDEISLNQDYYISLAQTARQHDVMLLLENQCKNLGGHLVRGICSDGDRAAEWIDRLNAGVGEERFGFCLNTGVCNLCGQDMSEFVTSLGSRLKTVILQECNGQEEAALLPFTSVSNKQSQTDWLSLIRSLRRIDFDGQLILHFSDTAAGFSPLLRPGLLKLAQSVGEYFKWQIGIEHALKKYSSIVLFGAGNMCRNYMKCYGEAYPPLFTCDNNKSLWGTEFCGLEVKAPEALKELPDDCGIFICNIYYREIEKQLREMGLTNIEFFNDEYMPSFHFDRLERRD
ncbi:MAG: hypothetical protein J1E61_07500 [Lachnospiraceae bacterium]|nr:hypothetical protein [Lachnospiraceae bacterium]